MSAEPLIRVPPPHPRLIAITGFKGSGKSSAAAVLQRSGYYRIRFAGPIKYMLSMLGLSAQELDGDLKEAPCELLCGRTPRFAMQTLGTEWGRQMIGEGLWVAVMKHKLAVHWRAEPRTPVVIDDLRFENERQLVKSLGGLVWRVRRQGAGSVDGHLSELGMGALDADWELENSGTLLDLERLIQAAIAETAP